MRAVIIPVTATAFAMVTLPEDLQYSLMPFSTHLPIQHFLKSYSTHLPIQYSLKPYLFTNTHTQIHQFISWIHSYCDSLLDDSVCVYVSVYVCL